jgi:hypothetical protein
MQAAVAGGLGVTVLGRSFVQMGMQILEAPEHWPALPMTEITVIGEDGKAADLVQTLVSFLTESLAGQRTCQIGAWCAVEELATCREGACFYRVLYLYPRERLIGTDCSLIGRAARRERPVLYLCPRAPRLDMCPGGLATTDAQ